MRPLIILHRWLGVAFSLFFTMWFATGIVMHFVPFPQLSEAERVAGLSPVDLARVAASPAAAVAASGLADVTRVRLMRRSDAPIYIVYGQTALKALRADDLADGAVRADQIALAIASDDARRRHLADAQAAVAGRPVYDQWTVAEHFDPHRPLYRIALNDGAGMELYVSSATGEVVQQTTRRQRAWNYAGSVAHWIYPGVLRHRAALWTATVWSLALAALLCALAGTVLGIAQIGGGGGLTPYGGWQALHHLLGLVCMSFVLTFMFSGWLSMDSGLLFSTGRPTGREAAIVAGSPDWNAVSADEVSRVGSQAVEVEWFAFGGRIYRRERRSFSNQRLALAGPRPDSAAALQHYLGAAELDALAPRPSAGCDAAVIVTRDDDYVVASSMPGAPVFRLRCGDVWFDIDGANGALLEKLDPSRRLYRWLYDGLHTLDFPVLLRHPTARTVLVVALCACGFLFSLSGIVLALRRLRLGFRTPEQSRA